MRPFDLSLVGWRFVALSVGVAAVVVVVAVYVAGRRLGESHAEARHVLVRTIGVIAGWMALTGGVGARGVFSHRNARPSPLAAMFIAVFVVSIVLGALRVGKRLARGLPLAALVGFHGFRLPLEILMDAAARDGTMPVQVSFSGRNFDIATGITALVVAIALARGAMPRWGVIVWNAVGIALLANILALALLSTPMIHAFGTDPSHLNTFIAHAPYVWLPTLLVVTAFAGHIIVARRLRGERSSGLARTKPFDERRQTCTNRASRVRAFTLVAGGGFELESQAMMDEPRYLQLADATFRAISDAFEQVDPDDVDVYTAGDVLTLAFRNGVKCVINTQRPTRQVWLAAHARAWHFSYDDAAGRWLDDKGHGEELFATVREIVKTQSGVDVGLAP